MVKLLISIRNSRYMQYVAVITASLAGACSLMIGAWNSPVIVKLTSSNSPIGTTLTIDQASWVASAPPLGFILGTAITPIFVNNIGPKWSLFSTSVPLIVSWLTIAFSKSYVLLIVMRFIMGIADGFILTISPLYIGEVADKDIRGRLTTTHSFICVLGNLFVLAVGPFVSYTALAISCSVFAMAFAVLFVFLPNSPYFLVKNERIEEGKSNLKKLLADNVSEKLVNDRVEEIKLTVATTVKSRYDVRYLFSKKNFRLAFFLLLCLSMIKQFSGGTAVRSYLQPIIESTGSSISPEISSVIFGAVSLPSVILTAFLIDKLGRKPLYIISTVGCAITLIAEGTYFYLQDVLHFNLSSVSWLPTLLLTLYLVTVPIGISSVESVMSSELYAHDIKNFASAIGNTLTAIISFLLTRYFLPVSDLWGMHVMFWFYGACCIIGLLFGVFILPETKGKSFLEIQDLLRTKSFC